MHACLSPCMVPSCDRRTSPSMSSSALSVYVLVKGMVRGGHSTWRVNCLFKLLDALVTSPAGLPLCLPIQRSYTWHAWLSHCSLSQLGGPCDLLDVHSNDAEDGFAYNVTDSLSNPNWTNSWVLGNESTGYEWS